jgi:UDP-2,3-diacylglucosamine pyrophosphatase LpxH
MYTLAQKTVKLKNSIISLKHNSCETLYLVGDIIDAWRIKQNKWRWKQSHTNVVRRVLGMPKRGTKVIYVAGNHDEFLRPFIQYNIGFGLIEVVNQTEHVGADGKHYLVTHGDCLMVSPD